MAEIRNRSAFHDYFFEDTLVAGLVLAGTEVKSLREGKASFNDSYCFFPSRRVVGEEPAHFGILTRHCE